MGTRSEDSKNLVYERKKQPELDNTDRCPGEFLAFQVLKYGLKDLKDQSLP